jgi:soluble lytic murein transglycosylase-like protein
MAARKPSGEGFKQYSRLEKVTWYKDTNVHKYSNWGDSEFAVRPSFSKNRNAFDHLIKQSALAHNVDHGLVKAIIHTESGFNPRARSKPGAQGLMQLMPATAAMYDVNDSYDPTENIRAGTKHIKYLNHPLQQQSGAGTGRLQRWRRQRKEIRRHSALSLKHRTT